MNVVITGASRGLGYAMAERFAKGGHSLYLISKNPATLEQSAQNLQKKFPEVSIAHFAADLSKKENIIEVKDWFETHQAPCDVLINNAGNFLPGSVYNEEEGVLEAMIKNNLYSAYYLTRALLPKMMKRKSGYIINMCSIAALKAYANGGSYSISKFALLGFSKNLREEMKPYNICVTAVLPGAAYTDSWASSGLEKERFMDPGDIAELVFGATQLSSRSCVEEITVRPQLGDI